MKTLSFVVLAISVVGSYAFAQSTDEETSFPTAVIGPETEIRTFPPYGPFDLFIGERLNLEINDPTRVRILDQKIYHGFSGPHIWYKFTVPGTNNAGWANGGLEGGTIITDFTIVAPGRIDYQSSLSQREYWLQR